MSGSSKKKDKDRVEKTTKKSSRNHDKVGGICKDKKQQAAASAFALLLADDHAVDPALSSLFAVKQPPVKAQARAPAELEHREAFSEPGSRDEDEAEDAQDNDADLSELDEQLDDEEPLRTVSDDESVAKDKDYEVSRRDEAEAAAEAGAPKEEEDHAARVKRTRKRNAEEDDLEGAYMSRLAREEEKEAGRLAAERAAKRQKQTTEADAGPGEDGNVAQDTAMADKELDFASEDDSDATSPPPKHETELHADHELDKANRTAFLSNVSTEAISSKSARKTLLKHLGSFFDSISGSKASDAKHKVESIRFRSTPYASAIPKKAAYAKRELMDATTRSTNAYVVYSSSVLAREAAKRLNGTVVLNRHLRVDEVAHPAKVDNRRCIFVGNLGFVDDETNIQDANEEDGREKRKRGKEPADIEEGLWRAFSKCGKVESVRVIRDSTTRVGKGIAYVQFEEENAVEAALLYNDKKFPPMLPRKLRVSRAKAQKRNPKPGSDRPTARRPTTTEYQRKITGEEASKMGRASKLLGRAGAAQMRRSGRSGSDANGVVVKGHKDSALPVHGIKAPESFVFEGHRASARQGKSGLKLGGKHNKTSSGKKGKVTSRSASFKAKKKSG